MEPQDLAAIASGIVMGLWLDRILGARRGGVLPGDALPGGVLRDQGPLLLGAAALGCGAMLGQAWAGIALGCLLGVRAMTAVQPRP